jgi:hypothetical protein
MARRLLDRLGLQPLLGLGTRDAQQEFHLQPDAVLLVPSR